MVYMTFKESSKKHLQTCQCLIHTLESCNQEKKYLLSNILYLTGYTIETILKYRIFANLSYARDKDIKDVNIGSITWDAIKTHDLRNLLRHLKIQESKDLFNELQTNTFFKDWDKMYHEKARYENNIMHNKEEILEFFDLSKKLFQTLIH
jgi:hypothetical protein